MSLTFLWGPLGPGSSAPAPLLTIRLTSAHHRRRDLAGLLDTGADFSHLRPERKATLAVRDDECIPFKSKVANGVEADGLFTVLTAELDRKTFRMPVIFLPGLAAEVWGRVGLMDQFDIQLDSAKQTTTVTWTGASSPPWADGYETWWKTELAKASP